MNEQLKLLIDLQNLDLKILGLEKLKNNIPKEIEQKRENFKSSEDEFKDRESELKEIQKSIRLKEGFLNDETEHLKKTQVKLNEVKTNKEYSAILNEIESIKGKKDQLEEEIIVLFDKVEIAIEKIGNARKKVDNERKIWEDVVKAKEVELKSLEEEIKKDLTGRENLVKKVDSKLFQRYLKLSEHHNNFALAEVKNKSCQGCLITISPQNFNLLASSEDIISCSNCQRILYIRE